MNKPVITALTTIGIAQLLKIPIHRITDGHWNWRLFFETGGMPSSHSAGVSSLAAYVAFKSGVKTVDFALASIFGLLVMYDAQGVRRQAGELTIKVNELEEQLERIRGKEDRHYHDRKIKKMRERLGHQPVEVVAGALLGIACGYVGYKLFH